MASNLQILHDLGLIYPRNLLFGYLNVNSLRNKITDLRKNMPYVQLDYFALIKTKIIESFLSARFNISDSEIRTRRDSKGKWGVVIDYMKTGKICKIKKEFERAISESICSEMITSKNHCGFE